MPSFTPSQLSEATGGYWFPEEPAGTISRFEFDSRKLKQGDCFLALAGESRDGHTFLPQAEAAGAACAMVRNPVDDVSIPQLIVSDTLQGLQQLGKWHRRNFYGRVIGITGSCGKTTTREMLAQMLGDRTLASPGNFNNHIGVPITLLSLEKGLHDFAIVEMGMNGPGEIASLASLAEPDIGVITHVGPAHLDVLETVEAVAGEKAALAESVIQRNGQVYFPEGCLEFAAFRSLKGSIKCISVRDKENGKTPRNLPNQTDVVEIEFDDKPAFGAAFTFLNGPGSGNTFRIPGVSPGIASNMMLATVVALDLGVEAELVSRVLNAWKPYTQRGEVVRSGGLHFWLDCYNANPASLLDSFRGFCKRFPHEPHYLILGEMQELGKHRDELHVSTARELSCKPNTEVLLVGRGARAYAPGFFQQGVSTEQVHFFHDGQAVRDYLQDKHGAVFLKGSRAAKLETILRKEEVTSC